VKRALTEAEIYEIMAEALLSGRLGPGAKLAEERLAALFGVSRERMRNVLHRLGHERLIDVVRNRGAFVANPGLRDAREIYEARRIVEGGIAWGLAARLSGDQLAALRRHFAEEQRAHRHGNRADAIRLSGAFHVVLAEMTDNPLIVRQMHELVSRTSMLVAVMLYSTVTREPFFRSPFTLVSLSRAISHFSLPFSTTILLSVTSSTGPVTW